MSTPQTDPLLPVTENHNKKLTLEHLVAAMQQSGLLDSQVSPFLLKQCKNEKTHPIVTVIKFGIRDRRPPHRPLTESALTQWLAAQVNMPYFEIDPLKIDIKTMTQFLPVAYVRRLQIIPVKLEGNILTCTCSDPLISDWVQEVQNTTGKIVKRVLSDPRSVSRFIEEFYTVRTATTEYKRQNHWTGDFGQVYELDRMLGKAKSNDLGKDATAVIRIVDWLFQFACDERATDIHMEPKQGKGIVRFRIDGKMKTVYSFEPEVMLPVVSRIKILGEMQVDEKRKPQDGRIRYKLTNGSEMEMRLSSIPVQHGEKLVVRIFDPKVARKDFLELGFSPQDIKTWENLLELPHGIILVTGPTGSGKSTTLHTSLRKLVREDINICTIEDPVEILNDDLNQMQVNPKLDLSFAEAIRSFLRQDPDIIMVGEIRDTEAGKMAIQAALTGHLVLSTLHTNDALSAITRLIDLAIPSHLLIATLRGMMAQRLVRRLCEYCRKKIPTPQEGWQDMTAPYSIPAPEFVFTPVGCKECKHSGYMGRLCIYEIITLDTDIKAAIRKNVTLDELTEVAQGKYTPLKINAAQKVIEGVTCIEEVMRVVI